ncbi:ABC transporter ATP-binding protein [Kallotenue papyrolyticum]|uniref:ABC transporter ATP-binding protein n=1 Tax=Kallotenue papyrolyticum TaxID=1325125 RepID=UPI00046ED623|nr:ABC transporter ATP-binding protein [Kallotenue papyrolyticum]
METAHAVRQDADRPLLEVRHLTKRFPVGGLFRQKLVHALEDVSFDIYRGEVVALVGESGSGKSTTARLIARLIQPTAGKIIFQGRDVLQSEPRGASLHYRRQVQMIFQDPFGSLNPVKTIAHHLERPLVIHGAARTRAEREERILELLTTVGLNPAGEFARKYPHQLSGGQRQRVAIARALAVDPAIILADEPISMLDVSIRMGILNLMERLKEERGIGYLYITHDIASARYIGDRTMVMYAGHMVEGADSESLMAAPAHPYTQLLLSAVPNPHAGLARRGVEVRGEVPSLIDPPPGCPFAPRCPRVLEVCRQTMPGVEHLSATHWVRCHLYGPGGTTPAS